MTTFTHKDAIKMEVWKRYPVQFVRDVFGVEPDAWQKKVLEAFPHNQRLAMKACKGPGKTCVLAWICWLFLLTRKEAKILCTSITKGNMQSGLWPEMSKWMNKSDLLKDQFEWFSESIKHKEFGSNWFMHMKPWPKSADPEQQANTLAGMHADNIMFILDEAGGIPDAVMVAAEAALTGGPECYQRIVMAGNPTHREGPLWRACSSSKHLWWTISITSDPDDPNRTPRVSKEWARDQIEQYGRDNPWVLVNVFGEFPQTSMNTLLSEWEVEQSMKRNPRKEDYMYIQKRLGIDVARFGDDRTVICARQGLKVFQFKVLRNERTTDIANIVYNAKMNWGSEQEYVDGTGGYGAGVVDSLRIKRVYAQEIMFSGKAFDSTKFYNKRAEMWWRTAEWVKSGGALPNDSELKRELCSPLYFYTGDRIQIEDKGQIKSRLGFSPDKADALILTHADVDVSSQIITDDHGILDETRVKLLMNQGRNDDNMETEYDYLSGQ